MDAVLTTKKKINLKFAALFCLAIGAVGTVILTNSNAVNPSNGDFEAETMASAGGVLKSDINSDGIVNVFDLSILLSNYGKTISQGASPASDLNSDDSVNIFDLSLLLSAYNSSSGASGSSEVTTDALASGGQALRVKTNGTITKTITTVASSRVTITAKAEACEGLPVFRLKIDGNDAGLQTATLGTYLQYFSNTTLSAGSHKIDIIYENDYQNANCNRNVVLDKVEFTPSAAPTTGLFVSATGSDTANGSISQPYRTLEKATSVVQPGQTIYVRGGLYSSSKMTLTINGTIAAPIKIQAYPGETPIFDGTGQTFASNTYIIQLWRSKYVTVEGLEIRNSDGRGIGALESDHVTLLNNHVHHTKYLAMNGTGDSVAIEGNNVHDAALVNINGTSTTGWPGAVSSYVKSDNTLSMNIVYKNNVIHDNWGECLISLLATKVSIYGNTIYNCWSVSIYLDNTSDVTVANNYTYRTSDAYNRSNRPAQGILMGNESYSVGDQNMPDQNINIYNNILTFGYCGLGFWSDSERTTANTYKNVKIYNNVSTNHSNSAMCYDGVLAGQELPSGNELKNNILKGNVNITNISGFTVTNNSFPNGNTVGSNAITGDPQFINGTATGAADSYKLQSASPLKAQGVSVPVLSFDYWNTARSTTPTIGANEL